jgi:hypothetical protein
MAYTRDEMETTCNYDHVTKLWTVYTCVPTHITKLLKIADPYWKEEGDGKHGPRIIAGKWHLKKSQVRFAKLFEAKSDNDETENDDEEVEESA